MISIDLDKIDPKFRFLTDLLLFSDRKDLDLSEFKSLLKSNYNIHSGYFWNRLLKSSEILWDQEFWNDRINFILSLNDKTFSKKVENFFEKRMFNLIRYKHKIDPKYDIEYLQFIEYCKVQKSKNKSFDNIKTKLMGLPAWTMPSKASYIINSLIPIVYSSFDEYIETLIKDANTSHRNIRFLLSDDCNYDKKILAGLFFTLLKKDCAAKNNSFKYRKIILEILNDEAVRKHVLLKYNDKIKNNFIKLLKGTYYKDLENNHFSYFKNLLSIDENLADMLLDIYAEQLCERYTTHKRANVDKLCNLIKFIPQITPKKVLAWLSNNNKSQDIKYFIKVFPELKKLAAFT